MSDETAPSETADILDEDEKDAFGRPTKYRPEMAEQAEKLCLLGATDVDLADFFKVSVRTIERWKSKFPDFCQSMASATILDEIMRICRGGQGQTDAVRKRRLATFMRRLRVEQPTDGVTWLNHPDCEALIIRDEDWVAKERATLARRRERRQVAA